jgi:Lipocalin-like domain
MKLTAAFLVIGLCSAGAAYSMQSSAPDSSTQKLIGTWKLTSFEDRPANGPIKYPYGKTPTGLLIYDATGHMSIQIMKLPHPTVASGDEDAVTDREKLALIDAYEAYFGTYQVDWTKHVVTHTVEGDLWDVYIGTPQERPFELNGDHLTLTPHWEVNGQKVQGIRTFDRVR